MTASQDVQRINKSKCVIVSGWWELNAVKFMDIPPSIYYVHVSVPSYPQELKMTRLVIDHPRSNIDGVDVVNTEDTGISEWMSHCWIMLNVCKDHDIAV